MPLRTSLPRLEIECARCKHRMSNRKPYLTSFRKYICLVIILPYVKLEAEGRGLQLQLPFLAKHPCRTLQCLWHLDEFGVAFYPHVLLNTKSCANKATPSDSTKTQVPIAVTVGSKPVIRRVQIWIGSVISN